MTVTKRATYSPLETAALLHISVDTLRKRVKADGPDRGTVYGIPVIWNGWRWRVPAGRLNDALGLNWSEADEILSATLEPNAA